MKSKLDWALWYAENGIPVFPCAQNGKAPLTVNGVKDATTDATKVKKMWETYPDANIGGACGIHPSNLVVLDIDEDEEKGICGQESLENMTKGVELPTTWMSYTGGGGKHIIYTCKNPSTIKNRVGIAPGVDVRSTGGYIILPPSVHESGNLYSWSFSEDPEETALAKMPEALYALLSDGEKKEKYTFEESTFFESGQRNDGLFRLASSLRARGFSQDEIFASIKSVNATRCHPPLEEKEVFAICKSASGYEKGMISQVPPATIAKDAVDIDIPPFKAQDFFTKKPFEFLFGFRENKLVFEQMTQRLVAMSKEMGVTGFLKMYSGFVEDQAHGKGKNSQSVTMFQDQEQEYFCDGWTATESGITGLDRFGMPVVACYHPILPVERIVNVDTGIHKVRLSYKLGGKWRSVIEDKSTIADNRAIVSLARHGIAVTSDTSRALVRFLADVENQNYSRIPETASVGRLGWIDGFGFSPYDSTLVFDGEEEYRSRFEAIKENGSFEKWLKCIKEIRRDKSPGGKIAKIVLAASFASVLVKPLKCLPFFVHLWGGSETGKTVSLLMAASVWADPEIGRYIQSYNSTEVGKEMGAAFCNSLPLIIDELQTVKDERKDFDKMIYKLTQGAGRSRGRKNGGLQKTTEWKNCILSTGEFPIVSENSGEGAVNRTIEIDCNTMSIFRDPKGVSSVFYDNYGFAGKVFVKNIQAMDIAVLEGMWKKYSEALKTIDNMDKQTASAALILLADELIEKWIFGDGVRLMPCDLSVYLTSKSQTSQNSRALDYIEDYIAINQARFSQHEEHGEIWGKIEGKKVFIIKSKFDEIMENAGFNAKSFLGWAKENGRIDVDSTGKTTSPKYISGRTARCICLNLS